MSLPDIAPLLDVPVADEPVEPPLFIELVPLLPLLMEPEFPVPLFIEPVPLVPLFIEPVPPLLVELGVVALLPLVG